MRVAKDRNQWKQVVEAVTQRWADVQRRTCLALLLIQ